MEKPIDQLIRETEEDIEWLQQLHQRLLRKEKRLLGQLQDLKDELHERNDDSLITINQATEIMEKTRQSVSRYIREGRIKKRAGRLLKSEVKQLKRELKQKKGFSLIHDPIHFAACGKQADRKQSHKENIIRITDIEFYL